MPDLGGVRLTKRAEKSQRGYIFNNIVQAAG